MPRLKSRYNALLLLLLICITLRVDTQYIDISTLFLEKSIVSEEKAAIAREVDFALQNYGYFITEHPILSTELHFKSITAAESLFGTAASIKQEYSIKNLKSFGRGFLPFGAEAGIGSYYEVKEGFSYGYPGVEKKSPSSSSNSDNSITDIRRHPMQQENIWPPFIHSSENQHSLDQLFFEKANFCKLILSLLADHVMQDNRDDENYIPSSFDHYINHDVDGGETISLMRIFHYLSNFTNSPDVFSSTSGVDSLNRTIIGSSPHTDWGVLTVITFNGVAGLQFYNRISGLWEDLVVPSHVRNPVIINAGDYLKLVSGNRYHSPVHRVLCPKSTSVPLLSDDDDDVGGFSVDESRNRISFVFFYYPRPDTLLPSISTAPSSKNDKETRGTCEGRDKDESGSCGKNVNVNVDGDFNGKIVSREVNGHFEDFEFNTLLNLESSSSSSLSSTSGTNITFGDYIMAKWKGVYH